MNYLFQVAGGKSINMYQECLFFTLVQVKINDNEICLLAFNIFLAKSSKNELIVVKLLL